MVTSDFANGPRSPNMQDIRKRPDIDRGRAWVAMSACCLTTIIFTTVTYGLGTQEVILLEVFEGDLLLLTWILAMTQSMNSLAAPLAGALESVTSTRVVLFVGGVLFTAGLAGSALVTRLGHLLFTLTILAGTGAALLYTPTLVIMGYYFDDYIFLATGVVTAGAGVGSMFSGPLANHLNETYGWRGMFLMLAGVGAQSIVCAALCPQSSVEKVLARRKVAKGSGCNEQIYEHGAEPPGPQIFKYQVSTTENTPLATNSRPKTGRLEFNGLSRQVNRENSSENPITSESCLIRTCRDFVIACNAPMQFYSISVLMWSLGVSAVLIHQQNYVVVNGFSTAESALLTIPLGICNIVARLSSGAIVNSGRVDQFVLYSFSFGLLGLACLGYPYLDVSFTAAMFFSGLLGACTGAAFAILSTLVKDLVGLRHLSVAFSLSMLACGVGYTFGPPIAGILFEQTGDYKWTFIFSGVTCIIGSVTGILTLRCRPPYAPL